MNLFNEKYEFLIFLILYVDNVVFVLNQLILFFSKSFIRRATILLFYIFLSKFFNIFLFSRKNVVNVNLTFNSF